MHYSAKNNAFYEDSMKDDYIQAGTWPDDAKLIETDEWQRLLTGQSGGLCITANAEGLPELTEPSPPTPEESERLAISKKSRLLEQAESAINYLARAVRLGMATDTDTQLLEQWEIYSVNLSRVDVSKPFWPEVPADVA